MPDVVLIRPISDSWGGEAYKRAVSVPHGPLTLSAHLIDKGFSVEILDEIALTTKKTEERLKKLLKESPVCIGITSMTTRVTRITLLFQMKEKGVKKQMQVPYITGVTRIKNIPRVNGIHT